MIQNLGDFKVAPAPHPSRSFHLNYLSCIAHVAAQKNARIPIDKYDQSKSPKSSRESATNVLEMMRKIRPHMNEMNINDHIVLLRYTF